MKQAWLIRFLFGLGIMAGLIQPVHAAPLPVFEPASKPAQRFFVGEKLVYTIHYLGLPIGRGEAEVRELTTLRGRQVYHIVARVISNPVVDLIYRVRGEHHTFIDAERLYSLRYQIQSPKDFSQTVFAMDLDHEKNTAVYHLIRKKTEKEIPMQRESQDRLSCGYFFRTLEVDPHQSVEIPVNTEQQNWTVRVETRGVKPLVLKGVGQFQALEVEPRMGFISSLKKPGSIRAWVSQDERRIPLKVTMKAPLIGEISVFLIQYEPGKKD